MASSEGVLSEADVSHILRMNAEPPYGARNAALIMGGVCWGLTPSELSLVKTNNIIAKSGRIHRTWALPEDVSFNGETRGVRTEAHMIPYLEMFIALRLSIGWGATGRTSYRGLDPESMFFLNDRGSAYKLTPRRGRADSYQPRAMTEHLKRMLARSDIQGATPASFRDSFIVGMYERGAGWSDMMRLSGIKQKRTLENKVRPRRRELDAVMKDLFSGVEMPASLSYQQNGLCKKQGTEDHRIMKAIAMVNGLVGSGLVIRGEEHVGGLLSNYPDSAKQAVVALFTQGRSYGVYLYRDQAFFDVVEFARKLGELGFTAAEAKEVIANLRTESPPESGKIEEF